MQTIALIIHLLLAIALIVVVLLQRSEGGGLGMGGGQSGMFSARGTANALTRATAILGACFMAMSLFLAILAGQTSDGGSIFDQVPAVTQTPNSASAGDNANNSNTESAPSNAVPLAN